MLGLSGGIDSAVVAALAAQAGPGNVTALLMPSPYTSAQSVSDALKLAGNLKIKSEILPIKNIYSAFLKTLGGTPGKGVPLYMQNLQARARGSLLITREH